LALAGRDSWAQTTDVMTIRHVANPVLISSFCNKGTKETKAFSPQRNAILRQ
jgi:hypothetical protein